jgi:diguanylate cyclase (GGDEF)-like protein
LIHLRTPVGSADVASGWNQAGSILIKSHPGFAYNSLWDDALNVTSWFAICALFVLFAGSLGLRILLKPLVLVERQADALCRKEYRIQEPLPWTRDFRRVVEAMNRMTNKVKEMFDEQVVQAEGLRERAYHDSLTGLGNRRYFESQLAGRLEHPDTEAKGIVILVRIHELDNINRLKGFDAGDTLLKRIAEMLREAAGTYPNAVLARLTGGDFGIFCPNVSEWDAELIAKNVAEGLGRVAAEQISITNNIGNVGATAYNTVTTVSRLLSDADLALGSAMQKGANEWDIRFISAESNSMPLGQHQWQEILVTSLREKRIGLVFQPVIDSSPDRKLMHLEVLSRLIREDGTLLNAGVFMPLAERLKLTSTIDRLVIEAASRIDCRKLETPKIAINLSPSSLDDSNFIQWIFPFLRSLSSTAPRFAFEFSEYAAVQHLARVKEFSTNIRESGHSLGFDHYGQSFSKLGYLQSLRPEYVKIDRAYTRELKDEDSDSRFYIGSLCSVAHSIDIAVIAEGVESEQQLRALKELNIDGVQGYYIGTPRSLEAELEEESI